MRDVIFVFYIQFAFRFNADFLFQNLISKYAQIQEDMINICCSNLQLKDRHKISMLIALVNYRKFMQQFFNKFSLHSVE